MDEDRATTIARRLVALSGDDAQLARTAERLRQLRDIEIELIARYSLPRATLDTMARLEAELERMGCDDHQEPQRNNQRRAGHAPRLAG